MAKVELRPTIQLLQQGLCLQSGGDGRNTEAAHLLPG
jgi:hypothetical protein